MNILKWKGLDIDPKEIHESVTTKAQISQIDTAFNESTSESGITVLYPKIEAIHEGRTRNFNRYTAEKLKGNHELKVVFIVGRSLSPNPLSTITTLIQKLLVVFTPLHSLNTLQLVAPASS